MLFIDRKRHLAWTLGLLFAMGCDRAAPLAPAPRDASTHELHAGSAVTFRVAVPAATPPGDTVFIAGDFQGWNPGSLPHALAREPDGRWSITLDLVASSPIQFKFTRGSWARVEKGPNGEEIANRTLMPQAGATYEFTVARWADLGTITGHVESFTFPAFLSGRRVWVYLPPGYDMSSARYPVLYMHDGQNLFDVRTSFAGEWQVDEACESRIAGGALRPLIVVGIENGPNRIAEYTPWPDQAYGGGGADAYLAAIRDVLIPEVDRRYRTLSGPNFRWMAGSSLGGLVSLYAGLDLPGHVDPRGGAVAVAVVGRSTPDRICDRSPEKGAPACLPGHGHRRGQRAVRPGPARHALGVVGHGLHERPGPRARRGRRWTAQRGGLGAARAGHAHVHRG